MQCPKGNNPMDAVTVRDAIPPIEVDRCLHCDGVWFDLREHEHLANVPHSEDVIDKPDRNVPPPIDHIRDIDCPRRSVKMLSLSHHEQRRV